MKQDDNINIQYQELIRTILDDGYEYVDAKRDVRCKQIDDAHIRINLQEGFPAISLKKLWWQGVVGELLWFLRGDTNIKYLVDNDINIWNKDAYNYYLKKAGKNAYLSLEEFENSNLSFTGNLGRVYGAQWRNWNPISKRGAFGIDQISNLIQNLKENPMSRRHIVTAWNPAELDNMALPPCHWSFEIIVRPLNYKCDCSESEAIYCGSKCQQKYGFTLKWHQRSVDTYLGLPFNIASYALLAHIIGKLTGMVPNALIGDLSNVHLYENSWEASRELIKRDPTKYGLPELGIMDHIDGLVNNFNTESWPNKNLDELFNNFRIKDFKLLDYEAYPNIPVEMLAPKN